MQCLSLLQQVIHIKANRDTLRTAWMNDHLTSSWWMKLLIHSQISTVKPFITLYNGCNYLSILDQSKSVSKRASCCAPTIDCFTSHVGEHRTVRGLWKIQEIPCFFKIPPVQQSPEEETPFVYVTLATHVPLATAGYTPCLFGYVTIGLVRHNRTLFSQSERLLVKPQRPCTDLCAEPVGVWNRLHLLLL